MNSSVYVKLMEEDKEAPGLHSVRVAEYYADYSCKIVYDESPDATVTEIVDLQPGPSAWLARAFHYSVKNPLLYFFPYTAYYNKL